MSRLTSDFLRLLSMVAVLVIHGTGTREWEFLSNHDYFSDAFIGVLLNQLARFSVPVFVILSGYGLSLKYGNRAEFSATQFYGDRALRIGLPFLIWTLLYLPVTGRFARAESPGDYALVLLDALFYNHADYHFYFFMIILQCYLVFPLLRKFDSGALWLVLLALQLFTNAPLHLYHAQWGIPRLGMPTSFILYWAFYFYTGMLWARRAEHAADFTRRARPFVSILLTLAFALVLYEYIHRSYTNPVPDYYNHFSRASVTVFALLTWLWFAAFDEPIRRVLENHGRLAWAVGALAALSFFVYITHTWLLRLLQLSFFNAEQILLLATLIPLGFGFAWLVNRIPGIPPQVRVALGLPPSRI